MKYQDGVTIFCSLSIIYDMCAANCTCTMHIAQLYYQTKKIFIFVNKTIFTCSYIIRQKNIYLCQFKHFYLQLYYTGKRTDVWSQPSCIYTQIFSPKKPGFSPIKNTYQFFFDFYLPLFYPTFQCGPYKIFKKIRFIFCSWKL